MKKSRIAVVTVVIWLFLLVSSGDSQVNESVSKVGTTAAQFLKIGAGARAVSVGGAFAAVANDISTVYWNPAGLARIGGVGEATFNHAEWLAETDYDFAAVSFNPGDLGSFALAVVSFHTPEEKVRTIRAPMGTGQVWDYSGICFGISFAKNLTDRFAIGLAGKYIQETLFNEVARGAAVDIGVYYQTPFRNLSLGAAISNFGTKMRLEGRDIYFNEDPLPEEGSVDQVPAKYRLESFEIPLTLRFGVAYKAIASENVSLVAAVDGTHPNDNTEYLNTGVEVGLHRVLFLRVGYRSLFLQNGEGGLTLGLGLRYDAVGTNIKIDFGWADYGRLKNVQFVSVSVRY